MSGTKAPPGHFVMLYFAAASSYTKKEYEHFSAPLKVSELFGQLEQRYPGITDKILNSSALTVNLDYIDLDESPNAVINERDEVAIIPPVSAG